MCGIFHASLPPRFSDTTGLWSVSLVILGFVSGSLLQGWCPPPHTLHPLAASQCWHPLPWAGGTGWMCTTQLYETAVTHRAHKRRYCQYSTLGLSCYYCWTEKYCCIVPWYRKGFVCLLQSSRSNLILAAIPVQAASFRIYTLGVF